MTRRRRETSPGQLSFLAPDDATLLHLVRENLLLLSELCSSYRSAARGGPNGRLVRCPHDVFDLLAPEMEPPPQEQMRVVLLDKLRGIGTGQTCDLGNWGSGPPKPASRYSTSSPTGDAESAWTA